MSSYLLLQKARDSYVKARQAKTPKAKRALMKVGDHYWARAEDAERDLRRTGDLSELEAIFDVLDCTVEDQ
jgi:hypothetical protein